MDKGQKEEQLFTAWIEASNEMTRRILTLSSAGIGLLATIGVSLDKANALLKWMLGASASAFVISVIGTLIALHLDPKLAYEVRKNLGEENSERQERLERQVTILGNTAAISFGVGLLVLLVVFLRSIYLLPTS